MISELIEHINGFQKQIYLFILKTETSQFHHFHSREEITNEHANANFQKFTVPLTEIKFYRD